MSAYAHGQGKPASLGLSASAQAAGLQAGDPSPLAKADQLYRTGKLAAAAQEYNALLQAEPKSALAYVGLVHVYLKQKKPAEAYAAAAKAVELAPSLAAARVALGEAYFRQGKIDEANAEFTALAKANTKEPRAYLGLSRVYGALSYFKHAKLAIDRAHALDPADPDIRKAWIRTLNLKERIKDLQAYLGSETNDDQEERKNLEHMRVMLTDQADQPTHGCRLATKISAMETNLEPLLTDPTHIRGYGLRVKVNGVSSKLMLDTGAGGITVDRRIADKAGIKRVVRQDSEGVGDKGPAAGYIGYADSIKIGDIEFQNCYVDVIEQSSVVGEDGLIGGDVFSHFLLDIDFPNQKFRLHELPPRPDPPAPARSPESNSSGTPEFYDPYIAPEMKSFSQVLRLGSHLLIPTKLNDLPPKLFMLDTGAFANTISPEAAREVTKVSSEEGAQIRGISGAVKNVFTANEFTIRFANLRQKNQDTFAFDTSSISNSLGTEVSGFLGFNMLRMLRIRIDYRDGLIDFEYDSKRFH
ncbi:MAG TPA: aspartyl protease family protein [Blastocatellia bacterium]|nr:aspartyl protease family protein [Blastocatellia bacterium]